MINLSHLLPQDLIEATSLDRFQKGFDIYVGNGNIHNYKAPNRIHHCEVATGAVYLKRWAL